MATLTSQEILNATVSMGVSKANQCWIARAANTLLAGMYIAIGGFLAIRIGLALPWEQWGGMSKLIFGAVFPLGLMLVVVCGAELFTGNCLFALPLLNRDIRVGRALKNLGIVYGGNLVGGVLIAVLVVYSHAMGGNAAASVDIAIAKCSLGFGDAFLRGILCNMLVCLAVWASVAAKNIGSKLLAVYMPVLAFVVCGFEHSIANVYYLSAGLMAQAELGLAVTATLGDGLLFCLLPSTLGNIIGGALIGVAFWAVNRVVKDKACAAPVAMDKPDGDNDE